jgi:hypothetical protein
MEGLEVCLSPQFYLLVFPHVRFFDFKEITRVESEGYSYILSQDYETYKAS